MSNKYPDTYTLSSSQDVALVRLALIRYQEDLRSDVKSFVDRNCYQSAFDDLNSMVRIDCLLKDLDSRIEFDDSGDFESSFVDVPSDVEVF